MAEDKKYEVKLRQEVTVTSEVFEVEAPNRKEAIAKAQSIVDEKDYEKGTYKLEAEEVTEPEPSPTDPVEEEEA